jgi:hypothetical protein
MRSDIGGGSCVTGAIERTPLLGQEVQLYLEQKIDFDSLSKKAKAAYLFSRHLRRALDETDQSRRAEEFRVLGQVWKKYKLDLSQFEDSPEFLVYVLQLLKKAEAVAQSRALLQAIFMPDAIVDRRRPSNGKTQRIRRFA